MVQESDLHQELAKCASLNVVVVGLADAAHPRVRGAVRRDVETKGGQQDALALDDLFLGVGIVGQSDKLVDTDMKASTSCSRKGIAQCDDAHLGAMISSYLAARKMAVMPTSCSLTKLTERTDRKRSMMLVAIQRVSGSM